MSLMHDSIKAAEILQKIIMPPIKDFFLSSWILFHI